MFYVVVSFPALLLHFFSAFLKVDQRKICLMGWLFVLGFVPFIQSNAFLQLGTTLVFLPSMPRVGPLFLPFNCLWFMWIFYDFWLLARGPQSGAHPTRQQVNFLLIVFVVGYIAACTNYLYFYGIYLPMVHPFATYVIPVAFLTIAYGVFAYDLFDINVVLQRSLVYSILVTLLTIGYFGFIYTIERIFQTTFGYGSAWLSLSAFALMALIFQPLKIGIQRLVDRAIFRAPHEELIRRVERLEQEVVRAEKLKAISALAAGLAHEIKNPLAAIKTFTENLGLRHEDPIFLAKFQKIVGGEVERINSIVQQLLDFAKPVPPKLTPLDMPTLIDQTLEFLNNDLVQRHVEVTRRYETNERVLGDPQQLKQVMLNLFLNSLDAMNGAGQLGIRIEVEGLELLVVFSDNGAGISPKDLPHIFEPFFTTKSNGTGLGLAVVHTIIKEHGGRIAVASDPGRGTTFRIYLPIAVGGGS